MIKNFRSMTALLTKSVNMLANSPRKQVKLALSVSLQPGRKVLNQCQTGPALTVNGYTASLTKTEITFVVPFIRLGEHHLAGHGGERTKLKIVLELPNGTVRMGVVSRQYEMIEIHTSVQNYLISADIVEINEGDAERYENFLKHGDKAVDLGESSAGLAQVKEKRSLLSYLSIF